LLCDTARMHYSCLIPAAMAEGQLDMQSSHTFEPRAARCAIVENSAAMASAYPQECLRVCTPWLSHNCFAMRHWWGCIGLSLVTRGPACFS